MEINQHSSAPPEWLEARLRADGGIAPNGMPNFRIAWSESEFMVIGGKWCDRDSTGALIREVVEYRTVPKFGYLRPRWLFLIWQPPPCSREEWVLHYAKWIDGQLIETMGPYPENGDYEIAKVLETPCACKGICSKPNQHEQYVPLTSTICDALIACARRSKHVPVNDRIADAKRARERKEKAEQDRKLDKLKDLGRPNWALNPHVVLKSIKEKKECQLPQIQTESLSAR